MGYGAPEGAPPDINLMFRLVRACLVRLQVATLQQRWDGMREEFTQNDDFMDRHWAKRLKELHPDRFNSVEQFVGMLTPALEMVLAMGKCTTPVQKVMSNEAAGPRVWLAGEAVD